MPPVVYTAAEVQDILKISKNTLSKMLVSGELPSFKVRRERRVTDEALRAYIAQQMTAAA